MLYEPLRLIYPYYNNVEMLKLQVANWSRIEGKLRDSVRVIVVDDCSTESPVPLLRQCKAVVRCMRLSQDIPWNMHQCRNIGAKEASNSGENAWLFMSDIDIILTPEMLVTMMDRQLDASAHYTMERVFAPEMTERKQHPNTFLVKHNMFWAVNGYDLDLTPVGGGGYGGDNQFMRQLRGVSFHEHMSDVTLIGYGRRSREGQPVLPDADTTSLDRVTWAEKYKTALQHKKRTGDMRSISPIRTPYERVL